MIGQIVEQCKWTGHFTQEQLDDVERQVRENTQVRFANISLKVSDEFMQAVAEGRKYPANKILVYKKFNKSIVMSAPQNDHLHYSYGIPSKSLKEYSLFREFNSLQDLNSFLSAYKVHIRKEELDAVEHRDIYGDYVVSLPEDNDLAIHYAGDFLLYFGSKNTGDIKRLVKAGSVWNDFVSGNYKTAEPGLIFWDTMVRYSPSNVMGRKIASTNPCGEVPLEDGGACNLASLNLSRFVKKGYSEEAELDWERLEQAAKNLTRFLDNVISWNEVLNPLDKQKKAAKETRRLGIGVMGIADLFYLLGMKYDSQEGIQLLEKIASTISNTVYQASASLAAEKGTIEDWDYDAYSKGAYFKERLDLKTQRMIKQHGLRNIALLSIAPTGTISNVILSYRRDRKNYIGISGGIEPVFSLFYTRRSESFGNKFFNVFHSTVQAYLDEKGLAEKAQSVKEIDDLRQFLPDFFFRTSHFIQPEKRVEIQAICQKYIDHSISSTVNLPESIDPETISNVYLDAWKHGLKGITIYRDGSRFPILSIAQQQSEFQSQKHKTFRVRLASGDVVVKGDDVVVLDDNTLSTAFHARKKGIKVEEIGTTLHEFSEKKHDTKPDPDDSAAKCEVKFEGGKMIKTCSE